MSVHLTRAASWSVAILIATVSMFGWVSEAAAQASQTWEFRGFSSGSIVAPFATRPFTRNASVSGGGTFTLSGLPCASNGAFDVRGTMTGATVTVSVSDGVCGRATATVGALDAAFPAATRIVGDVEITFREGSAVTSPVTSVVTLTGRVMERGHPHGPGEQAGAAINVAILTAAMQIQNISQRLNSLRNSGGGGGSASGVSFTVKGDPTLPGGGASADMTRTFGQLGLYAYGQGSFAEQETTAQGRGYSFYTAGLLAGAEYWLADDLVLGASFSYLRTKLDGQVLDSAINSYSLAAYGTYFVRDRFHVDGILTYGRSGYDLGRLDDSRPGAIDSVTARTGGDQLSASAGAGYLFKAGGLTVGPTGRVTYIRAHIDRYTERGPRESDAASIPALTVESVTTTVGAQAMYSLETRWGWVQPLVRAEWTHEFRGDTSAKLAPLVGNSDGARDIPATRPDRDYVNVGAAVTVMLRSGVMVDLHYNETLARSGFTNHSFMGGIRIPF